jgi:hypothetical protein
MFMEKCGKSPFQRLHRLGIWLAMVLAAGLVWHAEAFSTVIEFFRKK